MTDAHFIARDHSDYQIDFQFGDPEAIFSRISSLVGGTIRSDLIKGIEKLEDLKFEKPSSLWWFNPGFGN
jgi:hypothetical protein